MKIGLCILTALALLTVQGCSKSDEPLSGASSSDAVLSEHIAGLWHTTETEPDASVYIELSPTHDAKTIASLKEGNIVLKGTWAVEKGNLVLEALAQPGKEADVTRSVMTIASLNKDSLTVTDSDSPKAHPETFQRVTHIAAADEKPLITSQSDTRKQPPANRQSAATEDSSPTQPEAQANAAEPAVTKALEQSHYIPEKERILIPLHVVRAVNTKFLIKVDRQVPIDFIVLPYSESEEGYEKILMAIGFDEAKQFNKEVLGDTSFLGPPSKDPMTTATLFEWGGSKKGVYEEYVSNWVEYPPGDYTIILDNSGEITPTRGDAPVQITVWTQLAK